MKSVDFQMRLKIIKREEERYGGKLPPPMFMKKNQNTKQLIDKDEEER